MPSAPGCWKTSVAQLYTVVSHQPGLGLRQLSTGHGAICWGHKGAIIVAPACTTCHCLGLTSALVKGTVADSVIHVASALRTCGELFVAPCSNSPTLMPLQPSSWYRVTGSWHSWKPRRIEHTSIKVVLMERCTNCSRLDESASGLGSAHVERGMRSFLSGQLHAKEGEAAKVELCFAQSWQHARLETIVCRSARSWLRPLSL